MANQGKYYSASALAKKMGVEYSDLIHALLANQFAIRGSDRKLVLTEVGMAAGAKMKESEKYGAFIQWPENLDISVKPKTDEPANQQPVNKKQEANNRNATTTEKSISGGNLAKQLNLDANYINDVACIMGWASKVHCGNGYHATDLGLKRGVSHGYSGKFNTAYLLFPSNILSCDPFNSCVEIFKHLERNNIGLYTGTVECIQTVAIDGHVTSSIYHCIIDNWLLFHDVAHVINSRSPFPDGDFFLPDMGLIIKFDMNEQVEAQPVMVESSNCMVITFNPVNIVHIDAVIKKAMFTLSI